MAVFIVYLFEECDRNVLVRDCVVLVLRCIRVYLDSCSDAIFCVVIVWLHMFYFSMQHSPKFGFCCGKSCICVVIPVVQNIAHICIIQ